MNLSGGEPPSPKRKDSFVYQTASARANVRALVGAVALGSTVGLAIGGAYLAGGLAKATVVHAQIQRLAGAASGGFSDTALNAATGDKDAAVLAIAQRHDPLVADVADPHDRQVAALVDRLEARQAARSRASGQPAVVDAAQAAPAPQQPMVMKAAFIQPSRKLSTRPTLAQAAAQPFHLRGAFDQSRDLECLTQAVYYESRGESRSGQSAVAQVILNRVRHPAFPKSVCGVVFQGAKTGGCQFSFACDGQPHHPLENALLAPGRKAWPPRRWTVRLWPEVGDATHTSMWPAAVQTGAPAC